MYLLAESMRTRGQCGAETFRAQSLFQRVNDCRICDVYAYECILELPPRVRKRASYRFIS